MKPILISFCWAWTASAASASAAAKNGRKAMDDPPLEEVYQGGRSPDRSSQNFASPDNARRIDELGRLEQCVDAAPRGDVPNHLSRIQRQRLSGNRMKRDIAAPADQLEQRRELPWIIYSKLDQNARTVGAQRRQCPLHDLELAAINVDLDEIDTLHGRCRDRIIESNYRCAGGRHQSAPVLLVQPVLRFQRPTGVDLLRQRALTVRNEHRLNRLDPAGKLGIELEIAHELCECPLSRLDCQNPPAGPDQS